MIADAFMFPICGKAFFLNTLISGGRQKLLGRICFLLIAANLASALFMAKHANAEVVSTVLNYDPSVIAAWPSVDFNQDGAVDVSFRFYTIVGTESSGTDFLDVARTGNNEVLVKNNSVLPLNPSDVLTSNPIQGGWQRPTLQTYVWHYNWGTSAPQGVGAPSEGDYMGVHFQAGGGWHYGWIRFGPIPPSQSTTWPSVLVYAYETVPDAPLAVPEPRTWLLLSLGLLGIGVRQVGTYRHHKNRYES